MSIHGMDRFEINKIRSQLNVMMENDFFDSRNLMSSFDSETDQLVINASHRNSSNGISSRISHKALSKKKAQNVDVVHILNISKNPSVIRLPRIIKEDIRRKYPLMLLNTLNSMDLNVLNKFLTQFTHFNTVLKRQVMHVYNTAEIEAQSMSFCGSRAILRFFFLKGIIGPDRVIKLNNCSIVTRSTTFRTEIILNCTMDVHYCYNTNSTAVCDFLLDQSHYQMNDDGFNLDLDQSLELANLKHSFLHHFPVLSPPVNLTGERRIILIIDNIYDREELDGIFIQVPPFASNF